MTHIDKYRAALCSALTFTGDYAFGPVAAGARCGNRVGFKLKCSYSRPDHLADVLPKVDTGDVFGVDARAEPMSAIQFASFNRRVVV